MEEKGGRGRIEGGVGGKGAGGLSKQEQREIEVFRDAPNLKIIVVTELW